MKKFISLVLTLGLLLIYGQYALAEDFNFWKLSLLQGSIQIDDPNSNEGLSDYGTGGFSFGGEYVSELDDHFEMGLGWEFDTVTKNSVDLIYLPIFGSVDYFPFTTDKPLYLKARIGYNILFSCSYYDYNNYNAIYYSFDDTTGGLYYGFGMGVKISSYPSLRLEALYTVSNGSSRVDKYSYDESSSVSYNANISSSVLDLALMVSF